MALPIIDHLQPHEIPEAARIIGLAMIANPNSQVLWGGQSLSHARRLELVTRIVNLEHPEAVNLAVRLDGGLVGALSMTPSPHCQVTFLQALRQLPRLLMAVRGGLLRASRLQSIGARLDPDEFHWHLGPVGILPDLQGRGIGDQLYQAMCDFLDQQAAPGYLETDRRWIVRSLEAYGFNVIKETSILGVPNWCLWREPEAP